MKKPILALSLLLVPLLAYAQPADELPPPPPETSTEGVTTIETGPAAPSVLAPAPVAKIAVPVPVAEPKPVKPPSEDKTIRGVTLAPSVTVFPLGYDSINIGEDSASEGGRWFFGLKPAIGIDSSFKTAGNRTLSLSTSYEMTWREYFNKDTTKRDFEHTIGGNLSVPWNDRLSSSWSNSFTYFFKAGADTGEDNALLFDTQPTLAIKVNDQLKFSASAWFRFVDVLDATVTPGEDIDFPTDLDDFRRGGLYSSATGFTPYDPYGYGVVPNAAAGYPEQTVYTFNPGVQLGTGYVPLPGTKIGFDYRFVFATLSNVDGTKWKGHVFMPKITQDLPWKGGSVTVADELRLRKFDFATVGEGAAKQDLRNRLTIIVSQGITDTVSFEALFRHQLRGSNADDYGDLDSNNWGYLSLSVGF